MSFPKEKAFNPSVTKVPVLGASSGNPQSFQDPNSVASLGLKIQAATDQAKADTLYDVVPPTGEGFRNEVYSPWILGTEACKEGFKKRFANNSEKFNPLYNVRGYAGLAVLAFLALYLSFKKRR
uniref:Uncharacterized protein n=1 Tax=viral metagenome TaxID=1070528 RepID=A0A6C0AN37_9ZZZZ